MNKVTFSDIRGGVEVLWKRKKKKNLQLDRKRCESLNYWCIKP